MARNSRTPYPEFGRTRWPLQDQLQFEGIQGDGDPLSEVGAKTSDRNSRSWKGLEYAYCAWLGFLHQHNPDLLIVAPAERVTQVTVTAFVECLRKTCSDVTVGIALQRIYLVLRDMAPEADLQWLWHASRRIAKAAPTRPRTHVPSKQLFRTGLKLMKQARQRAADFGYVSESTARSYRKGFEIAFLILIPERRRCLQGIRLGEHLVKCGQQWKLKLPPELTKSNKAVTYTIPKPFTEWIDDFVERFRPAFPGANDHNGLLPASSGKPMHPNTVLQSITRSTMSELGIAVSPHGFRRSVATDWHRLQDVDKAKQMLNQQSESTTLGHYALSEVFVGNALTNALNARTASNLA